MTDNILPCPFCGENGGRVIGVNLLQVQCHNCGACGPVVAPENGGESEAISSWNAAPRAPQEKPACKWQHVVNEWDNSYVAACGAEYCFSDGTAAENGVVYCHQCGGLVQFEEPQAEEEDEE